MKNVIRKIIEFYYNRSFKGKIKYLRKKGCKIGNQTRLICPISAIGSEPYLVTIGENCLFSSDVHLFTHDGGVKVLNSLNFFEKRCDKMGRIFIGNNCFIGHGAIILPGCSIGDNCIVGAGSVVSKDIPEGSVCAGVPAKVICTIYEYHKKNVNRFFPTPEMSQKEKVNFLKENVK